MKNVIIAIAGGTGSGKTTIARRIGEHLDKKDVHCIGLDSYYLDRSSLSVEERERINYDHPDAFDVDLLYGHLAMLQNNEAVHKPIYSFETHTRLEETELIQPAKVVIIEGIMALYYQHLREMTDIKIYVDTDPDVRFIRRFSRDIKSRGRDYQAIIDQYLHTVRVMHMEFIEPSKRFADIIIPEGGHNEVAVDIIVTKIQSVLREHSKE